MNAAAGSFNGRLVVARLLVAVTMVGWLAGTSRAGGEDPVQPDTVWKGEIYQGNNSFAATLHIQQREGDRIRGELDFVTNGGLNKLAFQGNIVDGDVVVWITDKIAGNVTYPGLYIGKIEGDKISGLGKSPVPGNTINSRCRWCHSVGRHSVSAYAADMLQRCRGYSRMLA